MTITNGYATLAQLKQRTDTETTNNTRDIDLELIIQAASRKIDQYCGRVFYAGSAGVARYFTAPGIYRVYTDDFTAITELATDDDGDGTYENTWAATDYIKLPPNAPFGWPYTYIETSVYGNYTFPRNLTNGVKITGTWGWAAVPDEVREACLLISNRLYQRKAAPFGVAGANEFGVPTVITKIDPDAAELLHPFVRISL